MVGASMKTWSDWLCSTKAPRSAGSWMSEFTGTSRGVRRTAWEVPMKSLIEMAADRGAFVDQSQSLNLFMEAPTIGKLSSMYMYAWKAGLKTTYYLRSRPATRINKATTNGNGGPPAPAGGPDEGTKKTFTDEEAVACSLENPDSCEACD